MGVLVGGHPDCSGGRGGGQVRLTIGRSGGEAGRQVWFIGGLRATDAARGASDEPQGLFASISSFSSSDDIEEAILLRE